MVLCSSLVEQFCPSRHAKGSQGHHQQVPEALSPAFCAQLFPDPLVRYLLSLLSKQQQQQAEVPSQSITEVVWLQKACKVMESNH